MQNLRTIGFIFLSIVALSSCDKASNPHVIPADLVFTNGKIYTQNPVQPWVAAMAVREGLIVALGDDAEIKTYQSHSTQVVDLNHRMAMPGIIDAHMHPLRGAIKNLYECNFPFSANPEQVQSTLLECVSSQTDSSWIIGGQWDSGFFERFDIDSPRLLLDAVSGDKAVILRDDALHNLWVNTRALALAGISASTADPEGGRIVREARSQPNGILLEAATRLMYAVVPEYSHEQQTQAAIEFSRIANSFGITGAKGAATYEAEVAGLHAADKQGALNVHMALSLRGSDRSRSKVLDYAEFERIREQYTSTHLNTNFVKLFLDGVPTPARTAAMLAPYRADGIHEEGFSGGDVFLDHDLLVKDLVELDKRGFSVKMHAAGDRSVRAALDAVDQMREKTGSTALSHEIAHAGYIAPIDIPRFSQLNVTADLSPVIWHPSPIMDAIISAVGKKRAEQYWPIKDLIDSGAFTISGTDWPSVAASANPWGGIEAMVSRENPSIESGATLWLDQAISLEQALTIYTINGASALGKAELTGSLVVGKSADMIVLDHNLFEIPVTEVGSTEVQQTWFEGRLVYQR